jgi:hypothetical protein
VRVQRSRPPTARMIAALNLRIVFTLGKGSWPKRLRRSKKLEGVLRNAKKKAPVSAAGAKCRNVMTLHCHHTVQVLIGHDANVSY